MIKHSVSCSPQLFYTRSLDKAQMLQLHCYRFRNLQDNLRSKHGSNVLSQLALHSFALLKSTKKEVITKKIRNKTLNCNKRDLIANT